MTEVEFDQRVDLTLQQIEEVLDEATTDIDLLWSGRVLTLICENKTQIVFTRQPAIKQLWVACRSGGYHFDYDASQQCWFTDTNHEDLSSFMNRTYLEQAGEQLEFDLSGE